MKANLQKLNWIVDSGLLVGFLAAFFLNLTGAALHEWLGIAVGAVAAFHLVRHWTWVKAVSAKLFGKVPARTRGYYLVDAGVLLGFISIIFTGVVISSWLSLPLADYDAWKSIHSVSSVSTLLLVVLKVGLHWRWIVHTAASIFSRALTPAPAAVGRAQFLKLMGVVGLGSVFALSNLLPDETPAAQAQTSATGSGSPAANSPVQQSTAVAKSSKPSSGGTTSSATKCTVRCNKACSYPGRCRRYVDSNSNKKCDLGECL